VIKKLSVGLWVPAYGGNGGISSEHPDVREWMIPLAVKASQDPRIDRLHVWTKSDTPATMVRNEAVLQAREMGLDVLVMIDSDMKPDMHLSEDQAAKPFFDSSFDYIYKNWDKGPMVIGAPYCGPPPHECVYVFRWQNRMTTTAGPDYQLEMYDRLTASKMSGIQECAALPTGLIMYTMSAFDIIEPGDASSKPFFYYEYPDKYQARKASTEDVTNTRDISLVGIQKLGYNPVMCNWDAWAGHWKPICVGKPQVIDAKGVSDKFREAAVSGHDSSTKIVDIKPNPVLSRLIEKAKAEAAPEFDNMGLVTPDRDLEAIGRLVESFKAKHGFPPKVLEVGSWAGASALAFSRAGAESVTCVDTWEGSKNDEGTSKYDRSRGMPIEVFIKNTKHAGNIVPFCSRSPKAAEFFQDGFFDIIYLDAEHDEESFDADLDAWLSKASYVIAGHDYGFFDGVTKVVNRRFKDFQVEGTVWWANVGKE